MCCLNAGPGFQVFGFRGLGLISDWGLTFRVYTGTWECREVFVVIERYDFGV